MMVINRRINLALAMVILTALGLKAWLQISGALPFNSDEAIVALMARHILIIGERPIFFYGQAYMGSLDAYLVAFGFMILGQKVWVIRLVQSLLYAGTILTTYQLGKLLFHSPRTGLIASVLMAVPAVNVTLYTTVSIGGYGEALLLGNIILLTAILCSRFISLCAVESDRFRKRFFDLLIPGSWGFFCGISIWVNGLTLVYIIPSGMFLVFHFWRNRHNLKPSYWLWMLSLIVAGVLIGSLPWWIYGLQNGIQNLVGELLGGAVAVEQGAWLAKVFNHTLYFLLFGSTVIFGLRPPWDIRWLGLPLIPLLLLFWGWVGYAVGKRLWAKEKEKSGYFLLIGVPVMVLLGFLFTPFGVDPSGRYFLPFAAPIALLAADSLVSFTPKVKCQVPGMLLLVIVFNLTGTIQSAWPGSPGLTTQFDQSTIIDHRYDEALIRFLREKGETRGYSNYWVSYPLAFLSGEELVYIPALPYHLDFRYTARDDRYKPYDRLVSMSPKVAYITARHPDLDIRLRDMFRKSNITWEEKEIGDYHVFYNLSKPTPPDLINPGY
jgi:4-amino-4-deoxy-L-arabinose transferase-like glycosyltransferase